tara:strand:- start:164 stop:406 length:243 start_codon:yes stop_codon:yes gene_type:complete
MKNAQNYTTSSKDWRIISRILDVAELSQTDHQNIYLVYVQDGNGNNIAAEEAYGINHRTDIVKELLDKYGAYIDKVEHEE